MAKSNICAMCDTISDTYRGGAEEVVLINTSDVLDGKCLNHEFVPNKNLRGQFKKTFKKDDILYSEIRPANRRFCYVDFNTQDYIASTKLMVLRHHEDVNPHFLYQVLKNPSTIAQLQHIAESRSGTFPQITYSELANIEVDLPSIEEQNKLVAFLDSFDSKIETNNKLNAKLEELAQTIFKSCFVDFEPFKDQKMVESELGLIPEGWKVVALSEIADIYPGYSYKGNELQPSSDAMATIKNFDRNGSFKVNGFKEIIIGSKVKSSQYVNKFDVLVAHTDLTQKAEIIGNPAIILSEGGYEHIIMSMDLCKVVPKANISTALVYYLLKEFNFKKHALGYVNGTTVLHLSKKALQEYSFAFPEDIDSIKHLDNVFNGIVHRMSSNIEENQRLASLRDTLLPKLMSGEIEI